MQHEEAAKLSGVASSALLGLTLIPNLRPDRDCLLSEITEHAAPSGFLRRGKLKEPLNVNFRMADGPVWFPKLDSKYLRPRELIMQRAWHHDQTAAYNIERVLDHEQKLHSATAQRKGKGRGAVFFGGASLLTAGFGRNSCTTFSIALIF